jgi:MerR family Zn(II)-responsive transcriptional regulator of zntA
MKIGELAKRSTLSVATLRYYEKQGLLHPPQRSANGYRDYSEQTLSYVQLILQAKQVGFSLKECKVLLSIFQSKDQYRCEDVKALAETKLHEIQSKIQKLNTMYTTLHTISKACCGGKESAINCTILGALEKNT